MDTGIHVCSGIAVILRVDPRVAFTLLDQVEVQFAASVGQDGLTLRGVRRDQPLHGEDAVPGFPNSSDGQPVLIRGRRRVAVAKLYVFRPLVHSPVYPPPLWLRFSHSDRPNNPLSPVLGRTRRSAPVGGQIAPFGLLELGSLARVLPGPDSRGITIQQVGHWRAAAYTCPSGSIRNHRQANHITLTSPRQQLSPHLHRLTNRLPTHHIHRHHAELPRRRDGERRAGPVRDR